METILEPDAETFPFEQLTLSAPIMLSNGSYFIKYSIQGQNLYIQPPKCHSKHGIVKAGKKLFCELLFTNENETFVNWIEQLEQISQQKLFENRSEWFETELEMHDIENSFTNSLKIYKSGKCYTLRTIIPTRLGKCSLKMFDESENLLEPTAINEQSNILTILEVQGIRCSLRNFQIDIEVKQMMIVKPEKLFERCIISLGTKPPHDKTTFSDSHCLTAASSAKEPVKESAKESAKESEEEDESTALVTVSPIEIIEYTPLPEIEIPLGNTNSDDFVGEEEKNDDEELVDVLDNIDSDSSTIQLKSANQIYYGIYKEALEKAKEAKQLALHAYLHAKQIKELYKLDDTSIDELIGKE